MGSRSNRSLVSQTGRYSNFYGSKDFADGAHDCAYTVIIHHNEIYRFEHSF